MADSNPTADWKTPISETFRSRYSGNDRAGLKIVDRHNLAIVQLFAKKGKSAAVEKKLKIKSIPAMATDTGGFTALPLSPGQWMLVASNGGDGSFGSDIAKKVAGLGYVSEQSQGRVCLRLSGERIAEFMERACRLDLHPSVAKRGYCAQTQMAQMGVLMHMVDDSPTYDLFVLSGFAMDFADWIIHTGLKYGVQFSASE